MSWMLASIAASVVAGCGPLLMVQSVPAARRTPELVVQRRRLRLATAAGLLLVVVWFALDRAAIAAGARSFQVAAASAILFAALFLGFAYPLLLRAAQSPDAQREPVPPTVRFLRAPLDLPVLLLLAVAVAGFQISPNDLGYRTKGAAIIAAGIAAYFLGRPRAPGMLLVCVLSGGFTLFAQWPVPWQRAAGIGGQLTVGILGLAFCARLLFDSARRTVAAGEQV